LRDGVADVLDGEVIAVPVANVGLGSMDV
jgi:hypothetical protein